MIKQIPKPFLMEPLTGEYKKQYDLVTFIDTSGFSFAVRELLYLQAIADFRKYCNKHGVSFIWMKVSQSGIAFYIDKYKLIRIRSSPYHKLLDNEVHMKNYREFMRAKHLKPFN